MTSESQFAYYRRLASVTEGRIGWLAGIIDGEGTIGAYLSRKGHLALNVAVAATSKRMIDEVSNLLTLLGINHSKRYGGVPKGGTRPVWKVSVRSQDAILRLLEVVMDHLHVKDREAVALQCLLTHREYHRPNQAQFVDFIKQFKRCS